MGFRVWNQGFPLGSSTAIDNTLLGETKQDVAMGQT
jgi:hypothetical protein